MTPVTLAKGFAACGSKPLTPKPLTAKHAKKGRKDRQDKAASLGALRATFAFFAVKGFSCAETLFALPRVLCPRDGSKIHVMAVMHPGDVAQ